MKKIVESLYIAKSCCGCEACIQICPQNVLTSVMDEEGFFRPMIQNLDACINCGKCLKVCKSHLSEFPQNVNPISYIAQSKDYKNVKRSSSGGAFWELASAMINQNGIVYGAAWDKELKVCHIGVKDLSNLKRLQGSKYVQSRLYDTFKIIQKQLLDGEKILFSGTPCQVYALNKYLKKNYDNLLTIDIICHGVCSPGLFERYKKSIEHYKNGKIKSISFRWKNPTNRLLQSLFVMRARITYRTLYVCDGRTDAYLKSFLDGVAFRESCYTCPFANINRVGDITIGDCDSQCNYPQFHYGESNSTIILNTAKGKNSFASLVGDSMDYSALDLKLEAYYNKQLSAPFPRPLARDSFYKRVFCFNSDEFLTMYGIPHKGIRAIMSRIYFYLPSQFKAFILRIIS